MPLKDALGNKALRVAAGNACPRAEDIARQVYIDIDHGRIEESLVEVFPLKGNIDNDVKNPHPHGKILVKYTKNVTRLHADGKHKETSEHVST